MDGERQCSSSLLLGGRGMGLKYWVVGTLAVLPSFLLLAHKSSNEEGGLLVTLIAFLSLAFLLLQLIGSLSSSHVALGAQTARGSVALTTKGVGFLQRVYRGVTPQDSREALNIKQLEQLLGDDAGNTVGTPVDPALFWGSTASAGRMSEDEWLERWHMAMALESEGAMACLKRLHLRAGERGNSSRHHPFQTLSTLGGGVPARVLMHIFILGSKVLE